MRFNSNRDDDNDSDGAPDTSSGFRLQARPRQPQKVDRKRPPPVGDTSTAAGKKAIKTAYANYKPQVIEREVFDFDTASHSTKTTNNGSSKSKYEQFLEA